MEFDGKLIILIISIIIECFAEEESGVTLTRHRRYLIHPDGDPARVQVIIGIGLPLDLEDEAVTIGYVIKILYHVPQNSTDYTVNFYNSAANGRSERMLHPRSVDDEDVDVDRIKAQFLKEEKLKSERNSAYENGGGEKVDVKRIEEDNFNEDDDEYLAQVLEEQRRENSLNKPQISRWDIYKVLENMIEQNGLSGRACILRTICEAADTPFTYHNGILGELAHILLTPSTSNDQLSEHSDNEYHAAERLGSDPESDCEYLFPECKHSILEMFSEVGFSAFFG